MAKRSSAGLVLFRRVDALEVLLGHMGGPFWANKDAGAWSIPKGEYGPKEEPLAAACREFAEELGSPPPSGAEYRDLGSVRQSGGKLVCAWAVEGDLDAAAIVSNTFDMPWPPRSGRTQSFPEIDRAAWFSLDGARERIVRGQIEFLDRLETLLS